MGIFRSISLMTIGLVSTCVVSPAVSQPTNEALIKTIRETVTELCQSPNREGEYLRVEGEAGADVSVSLVKLLGSAAAKAKAEFSREEWKGVRKVLDQNAENRDFRACVRDLTPQFLNKFSDVENKRWLENFAWAGGLYSGPSIDGKPHGADGTLILESRNGFGREYKWTYRGAFNRGVRQGQGKVAIKVDDGRDITLVGQFENDAFLLGSGVVHFTEHRPFELRNSETSYTPVSGTYEGQLRNLAPDRRWADGSFWNDLVANGSGELRGKMRNADRKKEYWYIWNGQWKDGGFVGHGRVTYEDGGYEEGYFHYRKLVEGRVIGTKSEYRYGVHLLPPRVYSGEIRNGLPEGTGTMASDDFSYGIELTGTFLRGEILNGKGRLPYCDHKGDCSYGAYGEFRDGKLFTGTEKQPASMSGGNWVFESELKDGKRIKHSERRVR